MNMISTGTFQSEMDASSKSVSLVERLVATWEKKNAKVARAGGVSLMALSLAACGSSSDDTSTATDTSASDTSTTTTPAVDASKVLTLSTNTDVLTGGSGDDTIAGSSTSLTADDIVDGAGGTDILKLSHSGAAASNVPNLSNVETIAVTNVGTGALTVNMAASSGYTTLQSLNSVAAGDVTWTGMTSMATLAHSGVASTAVTKAVFDDALTKGTADSVSITLAGGSGINLTIGGVTAANEFETYNVASTGSSANSILDILASDGTALVGAASSLVLTGDAPTTIGTAAAPIDFGATATIDASAATGAVTVHMDNTMQTITLGSGDDTVRATVSQFEGDDTNKHNLDGGAGKDTLIIDDQFDVDALDNGTAGTTATATKNDDTIVNFEVLKAEAIAVDAGNSDDVSYTVDLDTIAGITEAIAKLENPDDDGDDVTVAFTDATTQTFALSAEDDGDLANDETIVTIAMKDASGAADSLTVSSSVSGKATAHVNQFSQLNTVDTATKAVETFNLAADRADITSAGVTTVGTTISALSLANTTTLNISGSGGLTVNAIEMSDPAGTASNAVIDATNHSGNLTLGSAFKTTAADLFSITLGSGKNSITFGTEGLSGDKVVGTTGTDTVKMTEAATDLAMTVTDVDNLGLYGAGATKSISMKNATVTTVDIYDNAAGDGGTDNIKITNLNQAVNIHSTSATQADWDGDTITLDMATGVTSLSATIKGGVALEGTGILNTDATSLAITDANTVAATGFYMDQALVVAGTAAASTITSLTLAGGGASGATTTATLSMDGTSNVNVSTINAASLESDLDINGLTTAAGSAITLNGTGQKLTIGNADAARDAIDVVGGAGADTIAVAAIGGSSGVVSVFIGSAGVESLNVGLVDDTGAGAAFTVDAADMSGLTTVNVTVTDGAGAAGEHDEGFTIQNLASGTTVTFGGDANGIDLANDANVGVTLNTASAGGELTVVNRTGALTVSDNDTDAANNEGIIFGANVATATIKQGVAAAIDIDELDGASVTALTIGGSDNSAAGAAFAGAVSANDVDMAKLATLTVDSNHGAITFGNLGLVAAKLATVNASGDNAITIGSAADTTAISDVNASGLTGGITFGDGTDFTASADIVTGTGNDTVALAMTNSATTVNMGEKASDADVLKLVGANSLGITVVNLGSTTDQITQINGGVDSAVQLGIERFDASGLTSTFGVNVTGSADLNHITGSKNADIITLTTETTGKADVVQGNDGADQINMGVDAAADVVVFNAETDGGAVNEDETTNADTITNFDAGEDKIGITVAMENGLNNSDTNDTLTVTNAASGAIDKNTNDADVFVITGSTQDDLDDLSDVITTIGAVTTTANDEFLVLVNNSTGTQAGLYIVDTGTANSSAALTAAEIGLIAIINTDAAIANTDFTIV